MMLTMIKLSVNQYHFHMNVIDSALINKLWFIGGAFKNCIVEYDLKRQKWASDTNELLPLSK